MLEMMVKPGRMKPVEDIAQLYFDLKQMYGADHSRMKQMRTLMNNEMPVPLPELSSNERSTVANLALSGQDQLARRIASVEPSMYWPNTDPGTDLGDFRHKSKPRVVTHWHEANGMKIKMGKRGRFFLSYATSPVIIRPNKFKGMPEWQVLSPLDVYMPRSSFDDYLPRCAIITSRYTYKDLIAKWGREAVYQVSLHWDWDYDNDYNNYAKEFEVLEYNDEFEYSMLLLGAAGPEGQPQYDKPPAIRLAYAENLIGRPMVVCPGRITLDAQLGHFDGIVGMYQTQAALMALTVVAQRKAVWPTHWLVPYQNSTDEPEVVSVPNPYNGEPGVVSGGTIETQNLDPAFRALEIMDRMAEGTRAEAGLPAEFGGQSATNIRTGKRGGQIMGAAIDFTIGEAQDIFAISRKEENKIAIDLDKAYFPGRRRVEIETRSFLGVVEYDPDELWDSSSHVVDWPFAGVDLQNLVIEGSQRVAQGTMSRRRFMEMDPAVPDVATEIQEMHRQGVQDAYMAGLQSLAANPEGPMQLPHIARLDELMAQGMELYAAVKQLQEEVQREQSTPTDDPALQQPGLAMPGQGVEQPGTIPEMDQSMGRMQQLLGSMATTQTAQKYRK